MLPFLPLLFLKLPHYHLSSSLCGQFYRLCCRTLEPMDEREWSVYVCNESIIRIDGYHSSWYRMWARNWNNNEWNNLRCIYGLNTLTYELTVNENSNCAYTPTNSEGMPPGTPQSLRMKAYKFDHVFEVLCMYVYFELIKMCDCNVRNKHECILNRRNLFRNCVRQPSKHYYSIWKYNTFGHTFEFVLRWSNKNV